MAQLLRVRERLVPVLDSMNPDALGENSPREGCPICGSAWVQLHGVFYVVWPGEPFLDRVLLECFEGHFVLRSLSFDTHGMDGP